MRIATFPVLIVLFLIACTSQKNISTDDQLIPRLQRHINYLSDDRLEGRRTGTAGEKMAMDYIVSEFRNVGLSPKGTEQYIQSFPVHDGKKIDETTEFSINGSGLEAGKDFFPFPFSPDQKIEAIASMSVQEIGVPWFYDLREVMEENKNNPHFNLTSYIQDNFKTAKDRGAVALIFYNTSTIDDKLAFDPKDKSAPFAIPVIYVTRPAARKYLSDKSATLALKIRTAISEKTRTGHNVVGYIDNNAPTTIIIGAHYDHLGYGEDGSSLIRTGEKNIHNGADDNASGTAALIELAAMLKKSKAVSNNYLFIAFSGEELGLFGSKYFTENPTVDLRKVNFMVNMDMVGRLNDSSKVITIGGYGTSPTWSSIIEKNYYSSSADLKKNTPSLVIKIDSSGTGPSDHTSFYRKDIPVLFYFTGLHTDYHKPSDDADKINYTGTQTIIRHLYSLIEKLDQQPKLAFTKTRETQTTTSARFSVSLGIMPDYTYSGTGVRADGVSEGRPAQKAGILAGDIVIQLGDQQVNSLEAYMQALGKFKKGDKTKIRFKRGNEVKEAEVQF